MPYIEVKPAYGRDYSNQKAVREDWAADKDFIVTEGGPYGVAVNRADVKRDEPETKVIVRYGKGLKTVAVN